MALNHGHCRSRLFWGISQSVWGNYCCLWQYYFVAASNLDADLRSNLAKRRYAENGGLVVVSPNCQGNASLFVIASLVIGLLVCVIAPIIMKYVQRVNMDKLAAFDFAGFFNDDSKFNREQKILLGGFIVIIVFFVAQMIVPAKSEIGIALNGFGANGIFALVAILLGASPAGTAFSAQESTVVGYLMVIAVVLLLSSEDIWGLFMWKKAASAGGQQIDLASYSEKWGLTQRESDILVYLVAGRTKPWIAENLVISENTVGTHVRHIYQKAGVHGRQELLDCLFSSQSPDSREE